MKKQLSEEVLKMQKRAGLITESQFKESLEALNEDNLEVKKIARDLYSWFKKQGIPVKLGAETPSGKRTNVASGKVFGDWMTPEEMKIAATKGVAMIYYYDDKSTKQTVVEIQLFGNADKIQEVEKMFLQAYPNLEQYDRKLEQMHGFSNGALRFRVKEKTTKKGGLVGNTPTNNKPAAQPQQ